MTRLSRLLMIAAMSGVALAGHDDFERQKQPALKSEDDEATIEKAEEKRAKKAAKRANNLHRG